MKARDPCLLAGEKIPALVGAAKQRQRVNEAVDEIDLATVTRLAR